MTETEGEKKKPGGKRTENRRKEKGQNMKNTHLLGGCSSCDFYCTTGEILREQTCPPGEV